MNAERVYKTVKEMFYHMDEICEDYIIYLVGFEGFYVLIENGLLESRGVIDGRKTYALRDDKLGELYGRQF